jgi:hypothetical protein
MLSRAVIWQAANGEKSRGQDFERGCASPSLILYSAVRDTIRRFPPH